MTETAEQMARQLETLFAERLGLKRGPLRARIRAARRLLPADIRRDAQAVAEAAALSGHPRLGPAMAGGGVADAFARVRAYLEGPKPAEARTLRRLRIAAGLVFNMLVVAALLVAVLAWRGFV